MSDTRTPEELEKLVVKMRALGVTEFDGIKLGADPKLAQKPEHSHENEAKRAQDEALRHRDTMFAACNVKPKLKFGGK